MAQHYLLSKKARSLKLAKVLRMQERTAYDWFCKARWPETGGKAYCPACGTLHCYVLTRRRFRCSDKECRKEFTVTSGTIFASRKLPFRTMVAALFMAANNVKGECALKLCRTLGTTYKTAWVLLMKVREAVSLERHSLQLNGVVEIDAMYVGGHVKPANRKEDRIDRRLAENQTGKRRAVMALRMRKGRIITMVSEAETADAARAMVERFVSKEAEMRADESTAYEVLHGLRPTIRVNHSLSYANIDGESTNQVESFFGRVRRAEHGVHHHISGNYLDWYAADIAWREDMRRHDNGWLTKALLRKALAHPVSRYLCGYWQGNKLPGEIIWMAVQD